METVEVRDRLTAWFAGEHTDATDIRIDGLESATLGHSAETLLLTLSWSDAGGSHSEDVVVRLRPPAPGLLPPYDLARQFRVLRALEPTPVRAPRALWHEPTGEVLGREFYVMERLDGTVYETELPGGATPERIRRMTESFIEQVAAIHAVDLRDTGLDVLGDGTTYVARELDHWAAEIDRVQRGPLPALERLVEALRERQPAPCEQPTLVHGDAKPGNYGYDGDEVAVVYDWELAMPGDPRCDIGWVELLWKFPVGLPTAPGALTIGELLARYEELSGIELRQRSWYRAMQGLKMSVINLCGSMLFDAGHSDDVRFLGLGHSVQWLTQMALAELGIDEEIEPGPVLPRTERIAEVSGRSQP